MAFIPFANGIEVAVRGSLHGKACANVINVSAGHTPLTADVEAVAGIVDAWMGDTWLGIVSAEYAYEQTYAKSLAGVSVPEATVTTNAGVGAIAETTPVQNNVTFAIAFKTGIAGRSQRGRWYVAGLTDGDFVGANTVEAGRADRWRDALQLLRTVLADENYPLQIASRIHDNAPRLVGQLTPVNAVAYTDLRSDSMRSRLKGAV